MHDARRAAASADDPLGPGARKGAVAIHIARLGRQHRLQLGRVVNVRGRDLNATDQPGFLVGCDVRLVATAEGLLVSTYWGWMARALTPKRRRR